MPAKDDSSDKEKCLDLFLKIGLDERTARNTVANNKVTANLTSVINEVYITIHIIMILNSTIPFAISLSNFGRLSFPSFVILVAFVLCFLGCCYWWMQSNGWKSSLYGNICHCMFLNLCYTRNSRRFYVLYAAMLSEICEFTIKRDCTFYCDFLWRAVDMVVSVDLCGRLRRSTLQMPCRIVQHYYNTLFLQRCA